MFIHDCWDPCQSHWGHGEKQKQKQKGHNLVYFQCIIVSFVGKVHHQYRGIQEWRSLCTSCSDVGTYVVSINSDEVAKF